MGDTKNFNIARVKIGLNVILSTESNDVHFGRVVICAFLDRLGYGLLFCILCSRFHISIGSGYGHRLNNLCTLEIDCSWVGPYVRWYISNQHIRCVWAKIFRFQFMDRWIADFLICNIRCEFIPQLFYCFGEIRVFNG